MLKPVDPALFLFNAPPLNFGPVLAPVLRPETPKFGADKSSTAASTGLRIGYLWEALLGATGGTQTHARRTGES
jgi:hypothetical protein